MASLVQCAAGTPIRRRTVLSAATAGAVATSLSAPFTAPTAAHASVGPTDDSGAADFSLVWEDDFSGGELDPAVWEYELGNIRGNEQQHYSSSRENVRVENGALIISVTARPDEDQYRNTARLGQDARLVTYNSGSVRTHAGRDFLYGLIEVRARLPRGKGAFPALWTLGLDFTLDGRVADDQGYGWPSTGEIDIAEMIGAPTAERAAQGEVAGPGTSNRVLYGTPHFWHWDGDVDGDGTYAPYPLGGSVQYGADLHDDFHVFAVNRTPDKLEWLLDGAVYQTLHFNATDPDDQDRRDSARAGLNRPAYLQINLATGGNWPGDAGDNLATDGTEFVVDWVRFSQTAEQKRQDAAYRTNMPVLHGVGDLIIRHGEAADLTAQVSVDKPDYVVELSVNDCPLFVNSGAPDGRNEVHRLVSSAKDTKGIAALPQGVYTVYYTALPGGADMTGGQRPTLLTARKKATLVVLPEEGIVADPRVNLGSVELPEGFTFHDTELMFDDADEFQMDFVNPHDPIPEQLRPTWTFLLPKEKITFSIEPEARSTPHRGHTSPPHAG